MIVSCSGVRTGMPIGPTSSGIGGGPCSMTSPSPVHSPRCIEALEWVAQLRLGQHRKGRQVPSLSHLIAVSALVQEEGGDEDQAIAALLHDAIEDERVSADHWPRIFLSAVLVGDVRLAAGGVVMAHAGRSADRGF